MRPLISWSGKSRFFLTAYFNCKYFSIYIYTRATRMPPRDFAFWAELFKAGLRYPRVSSKFEFRYESLKSKFSLIIFVNNLLIGYSKKNRENCPRNASDEKKERRELKFNPGLALIGLRTTGSWAKSLRGQLFLTESLSLIQTSCCEGSRIYLQIPVFFIRRGLLDATVRSRVFAEKRDSV